MARGARHFFAVAAIGPLVAVGAAHDATLRLPLAGATQRALRSSTPQPHGEPKPKPAANKKPPAKKKRA